MWKSIEDGHDWCWSTEQNKFFPNFSVCKLSSLWTEVFMMNFGITLHSRTHPRILTSDISLPGCHMQHEPKVVKCLTRFPFILLQHAKRNTIVFWLGQPCNLPLPEYSQWWPHLLDCWLLNEKVFHLGALTWMIPVGKGQAAFYNQKILSVS